MPISKSPIEITMRIKNNVHNRSAPRLPVLEHSFSARIVKKRQKKPQDGRARRKTFDYKGVDQGGV